VRIFLFRESLHWLLTNNSSLVVDSLCDQAGGKNMAVVGLYCHFHAQPEQSTTSMLGSSFKQLATREGIPEYMQEAFQKVKKEFGCHVSHCDLVDFLKKAFRLHCYTRYLYAPIP